MHRADPLTDTALGPIVQVAWEVDDLPAAADQFRAVFGAGPFVIRDHEPLRRAVDGDGQATCFNHSSGYGAWGELQVELVHLSDDVVGPPLRRGGGIHHVAVRCTDLERASASLEKVGSPLVLRAETAGGTPFLMHESPELGHLIELYEFDETLKAHYAHVASVAD